MSHPEQEQFGPFDTPAQTEQHIVTHAARDLAAAYDQLTHRLLASETPTTLPTTSINGVSHFVSRLEATDGEGNPHTTVYSLFKGNNGEFVASVVRTGTDPETMGHTIVTADDLRADGLQASQPGVIQPLREYVTECHLPVPRLRIAATAAGWAVMHMLTSHDTNGMPRRYNAWVQAKKAAFRDETLSNTPALARLNDKIETKKTKIRHKLVSLVVDEYPKAYDENGSEKAIDEYLSRRAEKSHSL
jgi:hypothetical protein